MTLENKHTYIIIIIIMLQDFLAASNIDQRLWMLERGLSGPLLSVSDSYHHSYQANIILINCRKVREQLVLVA